MKTKQANQPNAEPVAKKGDLAQAHFSSVGCKAPALQKIEYFTVRLCQQYMSIKVPEKQKEYKLYKVSVVDFFFELRSL